MMSARMAFALALAALPLTSAECVPLTGFSKQDFDTLATAGTDNTALPAGWLLAESGTSSRVNGGYAATDGGDNGGDVYSFGGAGSGERALGTLRSGTLSPIIGACFINDTGAPVASLAIRYTGEMWRAGAAGRSAADRLEFQYSTSATTLETGEWKPAPALDFSSPALLVPTAGATDGNAAPFRREIGGVLNGFTVEPGASLYLRWLDFDVAGADDGLAIDDFTLTPQPAAPALSIHDASMPEGDSGTAVLTFSVTLDQPAPAEGVPFTYSTSDGTATAPSDYDAVASGKGLIEAGATSTTIGVAIRGDTAPEADETFTVTLGNAESASVERGTATGIILNDDAGPATCNLTHTISQIQGAGAESPVAGQTVTTRGIVTAIKSGSSGGYFLQWEGDSDPATSDGIFLFTGSSPPARAAVGAELCVQGIVTEFRPAADPFQPPLTQLTSSTVLAVLSSNQPLPPPAEITALHTDPAGGLDLLENFEAMRVTIQTLEVVAPTGGNVNEPNATATSNGVFFGVVHGVGRPFREPGIQLPDPLPDGAPAEVPRFDANPERIRVDSDAQPGAPPLNVTSGALVGPLTGPLEYSFRAYTLLPDPGVPAITNQAAAQAAPAASANELTIASFNFERFFDDVNDPRIGEPVLTSAGFQTRLNKASRIIRDVLRSPDVIGVQEVENLTTLERLAAQVNADSGAGNPDYAAYLEEGNDIGGIDVGFLVKRSRVSVIGVTQEGKAATYVTPAGQNDTLHDRPPLVLTASARRVGSDAELAFTVIVNHPRSLLDIGDPAAGARVRAKRKAQAEAIAGLIAAKAAENIVAVGDYNAFQFNDGFVDVIGAIKGAPAPPGQVVSASPDLLDPDLTDLIETLPETERYSYVFDGNAQALDHILVNPAMLARLSRFVQTHANADFPESYRGDPSRPERLTDHDQPVAYFHLP